MSSAPKNKLGSIAATNICTGGGSKKQGLVPKVGLGSWASRSTLLHANGQNATRKLVFCMNQLGGVGAGNSMFRTAGSYARKSGVQKNAPSCRPCLLL
jgi:hypothetical protein